MTDAALLALLQALSETGAAARHLPRGSVRRANSVANRLGLWTANP